VPERAGMFPELAHPRIRARRASVSEGNRRLRPARILMESERPSLRARFARWAWDEGAVELVDPCFVLFWGPALVVDEHAVDG
jgi:hypothetical protein